MFIANGINQSARDVLGRKADNSDFRNWLTVDGLNPTFDDSHINSLRCLLDLLFGQQDRVLSVGYACGQNDSLDIKV